VPINEKIVILFSNAILFYDADMNELLCDHFDFSDLQNDIELSFLAEDNILIVKSNNTALFFSIEQNKF